LDEDIPQDIGTTSTSLWFHIHLMEEDEVLPRQSACHTEANALGFLVIEQ
jgi:hypothetical protein